MSQSVSPTVSQDNLVAAHPDNTNALKSGVYSRTGKPLEGRVAELVTAIMEVGHANPLDELIAAELAHQLALAERMDEDIEQRGIVKPRSGEARSIVDLRLRVSRRIQELLTALGLTPKARHDFARSLAAGSLAATLAAQRRQPKGATDADQ
jgi:hypothetical protein